MAVLTKPDGDHEAISKLWNSDRAVTGETDLRSRENELTCSGPTMVDGICVPNSVRVSIRNGLSQRECRDFCQKHSEQSDELGCCSLLISTGLCTFNKVLKLKFQCDSYLTRLEAIA